jgi:acyl CoA:acetate/3-ketoacid CoA transferase beta subunit
MSRVGLTDFRRAQRIVIPIEHVACDGTPKLVTQCTLPLTARSVVDRVIADLGVSTLTIGACILSNWRPPRRGLPLDAPSHGITVMR